MTVNAISGAASPGAAPESNWPAVLGAAAGALGMTPGAVSAQLRAGASLSELADTQGVSAQTLTGAIAGALSSSTIAATTPQEREQIAAQIAQRPGGAAARYAGSDLAGELVSLETAPLVANPAATYGSSGSAAASQQSGVAVDELA